MEDIKAISINQNCINICQFMSFRCTEKKLLEMQVVTLFVYQLNNFQKHISFLDLDYTT